MSDDPCRNVIGFCLTYQSEQIQKVEGESRELEGRRVGE